MPIDLDRKADNGVIVNIRSSQRAINSVINDYHCEKSKCYVLEFGPNIDTKDIRCAQIYKDEVLRLFFSDKNWKRKGGDIAVGIVEILRKMGVDARLTIAGSSVCPNSYGGKNYIDFISYLNKDNPMDYQRYLEFVSIR